MPKTTPKKCPHKTKHTERLLNSMVYSVGSANIGSAGGHIVAHVIVTFCADCGEELRRVASY